jgi:hypothetical protein
MNSPAHFWRRPSHCIVMAITNRRRVSPANCANVVPDSSEARMAAALIVDTPPGAEAVPKPEPH